MAISDVLSEARDEIESYLDSESRFMYAELEPDIRWLLRRMEELQSFLDAPPVIGLPPSVAAPPPRFTERFPDRG